MSKIRIRIISVIINYKQLIINFLIGFFLLAFPFVVDKIIDRDSSESSGQWWFILIGIIFMVGKPIQAFANYTKWKVFQILGEFFTLSFALGEFIFAFILVNYGFIIILFISIWMLPLLIFNSAPSISTTCYISLTFGFFMNIYFHKIIVNMMIKVAGKNDAKVKSLIQTYYNKNFVLIYIYMSYLLALLVFNIMDFENLYPDGWSYRANKAVLQSFITFIAVERVVNNLNVFDSIPKKRVLYFILFCIFIWFVIYFSLIVLPTI